jgi:hypothetical protein
MSWAVTLERGISDTMTHRRGFDKESLGGMEAQAIESHYRTKSRGIRDPTDEIHLSEE